MDEICTEILKIGCLNYYRQCEYVKNKLLSNDPIDITHTIFFKKLHVILEKLPERLKELDASKGKIDDAFFKFWCDFEDKTYFYDVRRYIQLKYVKLTNNAYLVSIPTKNSQTLRLNIDTN